MATFELKIATESKEELVELVTKMCGATAPTVRVDNRTDAVLEVVTTVQERDEGVEPLGELPIIAGTPRPERDAHGIKYDTRAHANAADPFKADGTWKRRKNLSEQEYNSVMDELAREAFSAGVYTGPELASLQLESQVVDTEQQAAPVTPAVPEFTAPPPAPAADIPTPTAGMSAESVPQASKVIGDLVRAYGPAAGKLLLNACGATTAFDLTPDHLRAGLAIAEKGLANPIAPTERALKGPQAFADEAINYGIVVAV